MRKEDIPGITPGFSDEDLRDIWSRVKNYGCAFKVFADFLASDEEGAKRKITQLYGEEYLQQELNRKGKKHTYKNSKRRKKNDIT